MRIEINLTEEVAKAIQEKADYQTKTIAFRVRVEWVESIKSTVKAKVAELSQNGS